MSEWMKIIAQGTPTLREFAEKHGLTLVVRERPRAMGNMRYYASFEGAEVKGHGVLIGAYGNGASPEAAARAYIDEIVDKTLIIRAYSINREEILVGRIAGVE